ncbi:DUF881 domain-containing protein [Timonella sp. A28]|uniref:DUF881 domain-containing protein n=1 Tax=Timonella sp. A28 TaxID=3442640 RepID=UPI003EBE5448
MPSEKPEQPDTSHSDEPIVDSPRVPEEEEPTTEPPVENSEVLTQDTAEETHDGIADEPAPASAPQDPQLTDLSDSERQKQIKVSEFFKGVHYGDSVSSAQESSAQSPDSAPLLDEDEPSEQAATLSPAEESAELSEPDTDAHTPSVQAHKQKHVLLHALKPRLTRAQGLAALLLGLLGFALVVQIQQSHKDEFSGLRQSELVSLLDDVGRKTNELEAEAQRLRELENELKSGSSSHSAALEAAEKNAEVQGILSGRLPAEGPGITIFVSEGETPLRASQLFNILEELRNAGAEAVEVNGVRMVTSSYFVDSVNGLLVDGSPVSSPYTWKAIGDPNTMQPALEIPGGAMAAVRTAGSEATIIVEELVKVKATVDVTEPTYARPLEDK